MIKNSRFVLMEHKTQSGKHYDIRFKVGKDKWESFAIIRGIPSENKKTLAVRTKIHSRASALYTGKTEAGKIIKIDHGSCEVLRYNIGKHIVIKFSGEQLKGVYHFINIKNKEDQYLFFKGKLK